MDTERVIKAAQALFDNRLGWSDQRQPYAPRELWAELGASLYGDDDPRVVELRDTPHSAGWPFPNNPRP
jgi:hypothetical protein